MQHASRRQGKHLTSLRIPGQEWPQPKILVHALFACSWHYFALQISFRASKEVLDLFLAVKGSKQYRHLLNKTNFLHHLRSAFVIFTAHSNMKWSCLALFALLSLTIRFRTNESILSKMIFICLS